MKRKMFNEEFSKNVAERMIRKAEIQANKAAFSKPAYSYTSICFDEKYRIMKKNNKLSVKKGGDNGK